MRSVRKSAIRGAGVLALLVGIYFVVAHAAIVTCNAGAVGTPCVGTNGNDVITGTANAGGATPTSDIIYGLGGDDVITDGGDAAGAPGDLIFGGPGNDQITITGGNAAATVFGEDGDDFINATGDAAHILHGGRGNDTIITTGAAAMTITDGPGRDLIQNNANNAAADHIIILVGDNEPDVVRGDAQGTETIILNRNSGRDVIDCGDGGGTVFLNGNFQAVDPAGNNLRQQALLGGVGATNCDQILP